MSYKLALEIAGAKILQYDSFGSYQGDWLALVEYEGKTGWVHGSYGSCSGCDAFEAEFGFTANHNCVKEDHYNPLYDVFVDECRKCQEFKEKLIAFGESYLHCICSQEEIEKKVSEHMEWNSEAYKMVDFVQQWAIRKEDKNAKSD